MSKVIAVLLFIGVVVSIKKDGSLFGVCYPKNGNMKEIFEVKNFEEMSLNRMYKNDEKCIIKCIWYDNHDKAIVASKKQLKSMNEIVKILDSNHYHIIGENYTQMLCKNRKIFIKSKFKSYHICPSKHCNLHDCNPKILFLKDHIVLEDHQKNMKKWGIIIGFTITSLIVILLGFSIIFFCKKKNRKSPTTSEEIDEVMEDVMNEVAKFTIGEMDFNEDEWINSSLDDSGSSDLLEHEELEEKIIESVQTNFSRKNGINPNTNAKEHKIENPNENANENEHGGNKIKNENQNENHNDNQNENKNGSKNGHKNEIEKKPINLNVELLLSNSLTSSSDNDQMLKNMETIRRLSQANINENTPNQKIEKRNDRSLP